MTGTSKMPWRFGLSAVVLRALWFRRLSVGLTLLTLALSVALFLSVSRIQHAAKASFLQTVSGLDLILAPRDSDLNVLLYSVFGLGAPTAALAPQALEQLTKAPDVAWTLPVAMGDAHRGYQVLATLPEVFDQLRLAGGRPMAIAQGRAFAGTAEVVLGAEVANKLGYALGQDLVLSHGLGLALTQDAQHSAHPFKVVGILAQTGSPFDRRLFVGLESMAELHQGRFQQGRFQQDGAQGNQGGNTLSAKHDNRHDAAVAEGQDDGHDEAHTDAVNFAFVGLKSPAAALRLQAQLQANLPGTTAVMPGLSLARLWGLLGQVEVALKLIAGLVLAVALLGLMAMLVSSLNERRREMAVFRALGARPWQIAGLLLAEAGLIALLGLALGFLITQLASALAAKFVAQSSGLVLSVAWPTPGEALALAAIFLSAILAALVPALRLYWQSLSDGLSPQG